MASLPRRYRLIRHLLGLLPEDPWCKSCNAPFQGVGAPLVRLLMNKRPSNYTQRLCNHCERRAREHPGGVEIELSMLFADIRGSTPLAEGMSPSDYSALMDFTVLGDAVNTAARLAAEAGAGEILVSEKAWLDAGLGAEGHVRRMLALKGKGEPTAVYSLRLAAGDSHPPGAP